MTSSEIAHSIKTNIQQQPQGTLLSEVYIIEIGNEATTDKSTELENWKKQDLYIKEDDIGQSCKSVRWVLS